MVDGMNEDENNESWYLDKIKKVDRKMEKQSMPLLNL